MNPIQTQGVHHITLNGADRQTSIAFWCDILGMRLIAEQPNLDRPGENHLYFDSGDGRFITVFTDETRKPEKSSHEDLPGTLHHLALSVSQSMIRQVSARLEAKGIAASPIKDRGFMDSIYFRDPLGMLVELACYTFEPPFGFDHGDVLKKAHALRLEAGETHITQEIVADAVIALTRSRD